MAAVSALSSVFADVLSAENAGTHGTADNASITPNAAEMILRNFIIVPPLLVLYVLIGNQVSVYNTI